MPKDTDNDFVQLAVACAMVKAPYYRAWRLVTAGLIASKRDSRGFWYIKPADLQAALQPMPVRRVGAA